RPIQVSQLALKHPKTLLSLADEYPADIFSVQTADEQKLHTEYSSLKLLAAGTISPHQLRDEILQHPNIKYIQAKITKIEQLSQPKLFENENCLGQFDHVLVCSARETAQFFEHYPALKPIRGQVSWLNNSAQPLSKETAYNYGGYCMQLDDTHLILGASFHPGREDTEVLPEDHAHNHELLQSVFPDYAASLAPMDTWHGRAALRAQSQDYLPSLGQMQAEQEISSFAALGSNGVLFARRSSASLAAQLLGEAYPAPSTLVKKLSVRRFQKKVKTKNPYVKPPI